MGKVEFLTTLIRSYPDLIWKVDENRHSIFHIAIIHRQEDIFKLIYEIGAIKDLIATYKNDAGNNMLHLVAKLAPPHRLSCVSGAALQMQREIIWFKVMTSWQKLLTQFSSINKILFPKLDTFFSFSIYLWGWGRGNDANKNRF